MVANDEKLDENYQNLVEFFHRTIWAIRCQLL